MKRLLFPMLMVLVTATQVSALSCARPNAARLFNWFAKDEATYRLALGSFDVKSSRKNGRTLSAKADFKGQFMGLNGLGDFVSVPVKLKTICLASWCGALPEKTQTQWVFIPSVEGKPVLEFGPCDFHTGTPSKTEVRILKRCLAQGECSDQQVRFLERR